MIPIMGLAIGLLIGILLPGNIPEEYSLYVAVIVLTILDSVFGGYVSVYQGRFELKVFLSGIFGNSLLALALAFWGEMLNVPLYLAAVFAFGTRIFSNFSTLRRLASAKHERSRTERKARKKLEEEKNGEATETDTKNPG